ncbi:DUF5695 domain-containing protein [Flavimarina sp. Hel_I_48]|uniref:DUF5695 domain-containing protein n=1 Tax=Flavimarina sp. Hel_I_48 TaxID=1392488 RepID=UPI0004DF0D4C|nr:DUF5695 domain-containing protein [Flavimarina sp. Hel_I_48]
MPHRFFTQQEILVELTTAAKSRIYFEPKKLWITLEAGSIEKLVYNKSSGKLKLSLGKKQPPLRLFICAVQNLRIWNMIK